MYFLDKKCLYCSNNISAKRPRDKQKMFCNRKCASVYLFSSKNRPSCLTCKIQLKSRQKKYCSYNCFIIYTRTNAKLKSLTCPSCKNTIKYKGPKKKYCSYNCSYNAARFKSNENYFSPIDTEAKAYWLGFIFADGNNNGTNRLTLRLSNKDKKHVQSFKEAISFEGNVCTNNGTSSIVITSTKLIENLNKLGCIKNKSLVIRFPVLDCVYVSHFIRGYFDGDGCVCTYWDKRGKERCNASIYSGSVEFIKDLVSIFQELNIHHGHVSTNAIYFAAKKDLLKFHNFLYKNATISLLRKKNKFDSYVYKHFEVPEEHWMHREVVFNGRIDTTDSSIGSKI